MIVRTMRQRLGRIRAAVLRLAVSDADTTRKIRTLLEERRVAGYPVLCNLGCGTRYHPSWVNLDFNGDGEAVVGWDLRKGLPFLDRSCDVLYSSHAIEHFDRNGARRFAEECRRVLKSGGTVRLVAPDLEGIARAYLSCLDSVQRREPGSAERYEWIVIELLDQLVRHQAGGEMLKYWCRDVLPAEDFVSQRVGVEYWRARAHCKGRVVGSKPLDAREVGEFRLGGEVHQWMYDRYSLGKLLIDVGFVDVRACRADESAIEDFVTYNLDTEPDGLVYKPDSFFLEATAP